MIPIRYLLLVYSLILSGMAAAEENPMCLTSAGERVDFVLEERGGARYRCLYLTTGDQAPQLVWSHQLSGERHWANEIRSTRMIADRKDNQLAVVMDGVPGYMSMTYLLVDVSSQKARVKRFFRDALLDDLNTDKLKLTVTAPGLLVAEDGELRHEVKWMPDGSVMLDEKRIGISVPAERGMEVVLAPVEGATHGRNPGSTRVTPTEAPLPFRSPRPASAQSGGGMEETQWWLIFGSLLALAGGVLLIWRMKSRS